MDANCLSRPVLDSITDLGIFAVDPDGKIVFWNKGAQLALGYAAEEIVGQHESVLFPYDTPGIVIAKVRDEREEKGGFHRVDNRLLRKDGTRSRPRSAASRCTMQAAPSSATAT